MASLLEQLVDEVGNTVRIAKINIDAHGAVAAEHQVRSIPTLLFFKNGQCTGRLVGLQPKEKILEAIARLPSAASN